jgi:hypothetical protein
MGINYNVMHDFSHGVACVITLMILEEVLDLKKLKQWPQRFMIILMGFQACCKMYNTTMN